MARKKTGPIIQTAVPLTDFAAVHLPQPGSAEELVPAAESSPEPTVTVQFYEPRMIPVAEIRPNTWNPNQMSDEEFDRLCQEILDVGFIEPIVVVPVSESEGPPHYRILGGEHRYRAAQVLGLNAIPCNVLADPRFQDEELQKALTMRLIYLRGKPDPVKTMLLVREFMQKRSAEQTREAFAFVQKEQWEKMIFQMRGQLKKAGLPSAAIKEFDKRTTEARTAKDLGNILNHIMDTYSSTLPYGFMVFSHNNRKHTYIATTEKTQAILDRLLAYVHATGTEINTVLEPLFRQGLEDLLLKVSRTAKDPGNGGH